MAERRGACERLRLPLLPLLIAACGEAEEARRGEERGINCAHSPTSRDYYALTACGNRRRKTSGQFWAAKNPRLGLCVGVVALGLRRRLVARVGWQALFSQGTPRGSQAVSDRPVARCTRQQTPAFRL